MLIEINQEITQNHDRFHAFGIILFTEANAEIVKLLKDKEYYFALDSISGENFPVFVSMLFQGEFLYPTPPKNSFSYIQPIWKEPKENEQLLSLFDIPDSNKFPLFVLFNYLNDELYYQKYNLKADSKQAAYIMLKEILSSVSKKITNNNNRETNNKLKSLGWTIKKLKIKKGIKHIIQIVSSFRGVTGI